MDLLFNSHLKKIGKSFFIVVLVISFIIVFLGCHSGGSSGDYFNNSALDEENDNDTENQHPINISVPTGYHSVAFPVKLNAGQTFNYVVPDLPKGKNSYVIAIADGDAIDINANVRSNAMAKTSQLNDPTYKFRLKEKKLINKPIVVTSDINANHRASAKNIGDTREFFIFTGEKITAKILKMSETTIVYVDEAFIDLNETEANIKAQAVLDKFDNHIAPIVRDEFGEEPPLINGEARISIVLTNIGEGLYGYYDPEDLYPPTEETYWTNFGKIFYAKYNIPDEKLLYATLAHEFQHMVNYYEKNKEMLPYSDDLIMCEIWLNEGLSMYSEERCGYGLLNGDKEAAISVQVSMNNNMSLTHWGDSHYGQVYLFMHFLAYPNRYQSSSKRVTRSLVNGNGQNPPLTGIRAVEAVTGEPFKDTIAKYALSHFVNDYLSTDPKSYSINGINLKGTYCGVNFPGFTVEDVESSLILNDMPYDNSIRFFKKTSTGKGDTTMTITAGAQPVTLYLLDERE